MPLNEKVKFKTCEVDLVWFNADNFFFITCLSSLFINL